MKLLRSRSVSPVPAGNFLAMSNWMVSESLPTSKVRKRAPGSTFSDSKWRTHRVAKLLKAARSLKEVTFLERIMAPV